MTLPLDGTSKRPVECFLRRDVTFPVALRFYDVEPKEVAKVRRAILTKYLLIEIGNDSNAVIISE